MPLKIFELDPSLRGVNRQIWDRVNGYRWWKEELRKHEGGLLSFAEGYKIFGWRREKGGYTYREWLPNAKQVFLIGDFNHWYNATPLTCEGHGRWSVHLPDKEDGSPALPHKSQIKIRIETSSGQWIERVPAWTKLAWQDHNTNLFNGVFWEPPAEERYKFKHPRPARPENLKIYEAHVGMSSTEPRVASYAEFARDVLPRIKRLGYNAVQLMAIAEHAYYGSFGYHVTSFFAPSGRQGTPEELKMMIDTAHSMGIIVLMDMVHAHASSNILDGIAQMDGTQHCYMHGGSKGHHAEWDSSIFDYLKYEVLRFLLSNVRWWIEEYGFDGYRFDGITSMLYRSHGIGKGFSGGYNDYFGPDADTDSHIYLMLANDLIHTILPSAISIGEDVSGMPTLCRPVEEGGFGFDYRLAMAIPDMFIKLLKNCSDDHWNVEDIVHTLTNRRWKEKVVAYTESHDQAIVGDKTLAFWLMDAEMYNGMSLINRPSASHQVERGLSLHKMVRLLVLGLGGEAYLNFMGNEFGHPEWIDFPREGNNWSYHHCRRRFDLPDDENLRYKFFEAFDELMQACENRFQWLSSDHQYVTLKHNHDKVVAFERGDLLFVFNFHPHAGFGDYQIGMSWNEPMRCVLNTDEGRFGGHCRLEHGHSHPAQPLGSWHDRPHSIRIPLLPRTAQVWVKDRLLQGGVRVSIADTFFATHGLKSPGEITLHLEVWRDGQKELSSFGLDSNGSVALSSHASATFSLSGPGGRQLECVASKDGLFRAYFPGSYFVVGAGYLSSDKPATGAPWIQHSEAPPTIETSVQGPTFARLPHASPTQEPAPEPPLPPSRGPSNTDLSKPQEAAPSPHAAQTAARQTRPVEEAKTHPFPTEVRFEIRESTRASGFVQSSAPTLEPVPENLASEHAGDERSRMDLARSSSGLHFMSMENLNPLTPRPVEGKNIDLNKKDLGAVAASFSTTEAAVEVSRSFQTFGLHRHSPSVWSFQEWIPNAKAVFLVGEFNRWSNTTPLTQSDKVPGVWSCQITGAEAQGLKKGSKYSLYVRPIEGNEHYAVPAWSTRYALTEEMELLDATVWPLEQKPERLVAPSRAAGHERIYECHLGLAAKGGRRPGFRESAETILPRAARNGYTAVLLVGVLQCEVPLSMGLQPIGLFAPASSLGTPEDLVEFVSNAHGLGLRVLLSIAHDGASSVEDGLGVHYFARGQQGFSPSTGARLFDFTQPEVVRYLLSSLHFWMSEYGVDGFRFQGVTTTIYTDHGMRVPKEPEAVKEFIKKMGTLSPSGLRYLRTANALVHQLSSVSLTIADEFTNYPSLCVPVKDGGLGFDMRQASGLPGCWRELLATRRDEAWSVDRIVEAALEAKATRHSGWVLTCMESYENCIVGRRPLKVAMLSWETLESIAAGETAPHFFELAGALHEAGHEVHIFTRSGNQTNSQQSISGVTYHEVGFTSSGDFVREIENMCSAFVGHLCCVEGDLGSFDIIHGHDWLVGPAISKLQALGKKCVFTMHSTETVRCRNVASEAQSERIRAIEGQACQAAERIITVSNVLKEEICSQYRIEDRKVQVIYNGIHAEEIVNMEWYDEWTGNTKRDKGFHVMAPMFLFVGRMEDQKGPDLLLDAIPLVLKQRDDARFVFVGDGSMKGYLEGEAHKRGIAHAVCFTGEVKSGSEHLKALFKSCDALVVPSRNEPFGVVVLEAWAAGKPVVATKSSGARDVIAHDRDGFLVDPDPGSISWGICKICQNFDHARWMGCHARDKVQNDFNWALIVRKTQQIYYEQLNLQAAPFCRPAGLLQGTTLAAELLGPHRSSMGVNEHNILVDRGLNKLKLMQLLAASLGGNSVLTWMGSEFGQIDSVSLTPTGSGVRRFSIAYELADRRDLKFKHLEMFNLCMNRAEAVLNWLPDDSHRILEQNEVSKVLAYARGGCVFAFNFHPTEWREGYGIKIPHGSDVDRELFVALDTDEKRFGGSGSATKYPHRWGEYLYITLLPRSALVLAPVEHKHTLAVELQVDDDVCFGA